VRKEIKVIKVIKDLLELLGHQLVFLESEDIQVAQEVKEIKVIRAFKVM
jgi:hypothetical protein